MFNDRQAFSDGQFSYTNLSHLLLGLFSVARMQKLAKKKKKKTAETLIETQCHQIWIASSGI
jgi:hypothetical protein